MVKTMLLVVVATATASAAPVRHVPPAAGLAGDAVELVAEAPSSTPTLVAHVRAVGGAWQTIELVRRDDDHWVAVVPATLVEPPVLQYYIDAGDEHAFATPEWPHTLPINIPEDSARRTRDTIRAHAHRSRIHTMGEWVNYGHTNVMGTQLADQYYRFDADFSYRLWSYPIEEIRVGYERLLGDTLAEMCPSTEPCTSNAGFKVGGWFEVGLAPIEGIRFDTRAIVFAAQDGFHPGGRLEARLGTLEGSHVAVGGEYLASVGADGYFRLGWATVPGVPMAATVEVTNLPASNRDPGVRLYYDVARDIGGGVRLGVRVGYAARTQQVAGFTGGAGATVEF
jgi:hypothetical protein